MPFSFLKPKVPDYTAAYGRLADEIDKSRKDIKSAVKRAEGIQEKHFEENRKALMPVYNVTQGAIRELEAGSRSGRWNLGQLTLANIESFDDYVKRRGESTEVRTAFDYVKEFEDQTRATGKIDDPSYGFMRRQMERSIARRQAASGNRLGGAGAKELAQHMGDFANTKYGEAHARAVQVGMLRERGDADAYNRVIGRHDLERRNTMDNNQVAIDKFEANRQRIMQDLNIVREKANLGGVRDMVNLRDRHSQNQQNTILSGASAMADLGVRSAETRAQGLIAQQEAESAADRAVLGTIGTIGGAIAGSVGGPIGASIGSAIGGAITGGGDTPSGPTIPASWSKLRATRAA